MQYLKDRAFDKPIHIVNQETGESYCELVQYEKIQLYWDILEEIPEGDLCRTCKRLGEPQVYKPKADPNKRKSWADEHPAERPYTPEERMTRVEAFRAMRAEAGIRPRNLSK